jgi:hypothetical protein
VLVLGTLLLAALSLMVMRYLSVDNVLAARVRQTHALDAAAYSGALVQARSLNTLAFINRAHIAHQVAMAHLVTLGSWAMLGGTQARQLGMGNPPAHLIGMLFGADHGTAYLLARKAAGFNRLAVSGGELAQAYARHDDTIRNRLLAAQHELVESATQQREHAIRHVLHGNFPQTPASDFILQLSGPSVHQLVKLTSGQGQFRELVMQASGFYHFLDQRNNTARNTWAIDPRCPQLRHQLRRRGQTVLEASGVWQSTDTQSFHALRSNRWIGCYFREYPMGWGWLPGARAQAFGQPHVTDAPDNFSAEDFWRWVQNSTDWDILGGQDNPLANSRAVAARPVWFGGGLPAVFQLIPPDLEKNLRFSVRLQHAVKPGPVITTQSSAETYFERPEPRADGNAEDASLYRPYWQARLARPDSPAFWQGTP